MTHSWYLIYIEGMNEIISSDKGLDYNFFKDSRTFGTKTLIDYYDTQQKIFWPVHEMIPLFFLNRTYRIHFSEVS